jgi:large subunit ribosomal protein L24
MKNKFSKNWNASKQPRKQRKYIANAPLHIKRKLLSVNLAKELRKKYGRRNIEVRKNDIVKIVRGKFKNKQGKVIMVTIKNPRMAIERNQTKKQEGSKANVKIHPSNLQIIELNLDDKKRISSIEDKKKEEKQIPKTENKMKEKTETKLKENKQEK